MEILKVSSKSNPNSVAGAVANILKVEERIDVQVIGAGALNQLVKSIIICRGKWLMAELNCKSEVLSPT